MLLINGTFYFDQLKAGVQRYAWEVTRRLLPEADILVVLPYVVEASMIPLERQLVRSPGVISARVGKWAWIQRELTRAARAALLWSPTNRAPVGVARHVPTVHDLSVLDHPEWFRRSVRELQGYYLPRLIRDSPKVITDSNFTKSRILARFGVPEDKVVVVHPGIDSSFRPASAEAVAELHERRKLPERFVLALGTIDPRKNLVRLAEAWRSLPPNVRADAPLLIAGAEGRVFTSSSGSDTLRSDGITFLGYVDDADLPALYSAATLFAYPSLYEGFGFPPLEAMACGTPVLSSNVTSTAETLGDRALLVDPTSTGDIRQAIAEMLADGNLRPRMSSAGRDHVQQFSWETAAASVLRTLRDVDHASAG